MDAAQMSARLDQLATDIYLLSRMVHGPETETVPLGGTDTPSMRRLQMLLSVRLEDTLRAGLAALESARGDAETAAGAAVETAAGLAASLDRLETSLSEISAQFTFIGLKRDARGHLIVVRGRVAAGECPARMVLPAGARLKMDERGHLLITLGTTEE